MERHDPIGRSLVALTVLILACESGTAGSGSGGGSGSDALAQDGAIADAAGGSGGGSGGSGGGAGGSGGNGGTDAGGGNRLPDPMYLPPANGPCPDFTQGQLTFHPAGIAARDVQIWISDAARTLDGPLVFYWHATASSPMEALYGLGQSTISAINAAGGIVAAPYHDSAAGTYPWFLVSGTRDDDLRVADEVLACARQNVGVDLRRIHAAGMSAGGLMTSQMSWRRSGWLASVVVYSGGQSAPIPTQDASNHFPAMVFYGGPSDTFAGFSFEMSSMQYVQALKAAAHFAILCNHGMGHTIPVAATGSVWQFLQDHPFGTDPSPYAGGLPSGFPSYCIIP